MNYTHTDLKRLLEEYVKDPYNHKCNLGRTEGPEDTCKECDCDVQACIDKFIMWLQHQEGKGNC
jgi:hypothetical protein